MSNSRTISDEHFTSAEKFIRSLHPQKNRVMTEVVDFEMYFSDGTKQTKIDQDCFGDLQAGRVFGIYLDPKPKITGLSVNLRDAEGCAEYHEYLFSKISPWESVLSGIEVIRAKNKRLLGFIIKDTTLRRDILLNLMIASRQPYEVIKRQVSDQRSFKFWNELCAEGFHPTVSTVIMHIFTPKGEFYKTGHSFIPSSAEDEERVSLDRLMEKDPGEGSNHKTEMQTVTSGMHCNYIWQKPSNRKAFSSFLKQIKRERKEVDLGFAKSTRSFAGYEDKKVFIEDLKQAVKAYNEYRKD